MSKAAVWGLAAVAAIAFLGGLRIKEASVKRRVKEAYEAGYVKGWEEKESQLQPVINQLKNENSRLERTISEKEQEISNKDKQIITKDQEIARLISELEKLKPKEDASQKENKKEPSSSG